MAKQKDSKSTKAATTEQITEILQVTQGVFVACIVSASPYIHNRTSEKARRELLLPRGPKTANEKATTLKHIPVDEFRASPYILSDPKAATLLAIRGAAFKGAMRSAALDLPGTKKAQIGRLVRVEEELVEVFGIPFLKMDVVRSADMNRTPDIRTRAAMKEWACQITVRFVRPLITAQAVANLLGAVDNFIIWSVVVLAIGLGVLYKRRTQPIAISLLSVYAVIAIVIALLKSRGGA